jgi:UDP-GlcNAc:undecaprenyl-phosphate/decaprenyl-phosphate GlcNAc-1-phosphate transferase
VPVSFAAHGTLLAQFGAATVASLILTFVVRAASQRFGMTARPRADRWHSRPTALFGGVAIFGAFLVSILLVPVPALPGRNLFLACSAAMFALGLVDDFLTLKPQAKLVAQIVVTALSTTFGMRLYWLPSEVLDQALTVLWLVGITNALNLLDNIDGAAAGVAFIAALFVGFFSYSSGNAVGAALATAFAGAVLGFLVYNVNPASIFMGDSGSLFLGFFLGGISLLNHPEGARRTVLSVLSFPVLLLLIPILDTTLVTFSRKFHGFSVARGGRDHTSHRLVALGLSERAAALTLWLLSIASGAVAVLVQSLSHAVVALVIPLFAVGVLIFFILLGRVRVYDAVTVTEAAKGRAMLPTLHAFAYKRRVFEILADSLVVIAAYYGSYLLRFEGEVVQPFYNRMLRSLPLVVGTQLVAFSFLGLYRSVWRYTSVHDLPVMARATLGGWLASLVVLVFVYRLDGVSRSAMLIDAVLVLLLIPATRLAFRWFQLLLTRSIAPATGSQKRALICGAGDDGELLARYLLSASQLGFRPVGFVDDNVQTHGRKIHGIPVVASTGSLDEILLHQSIDCVLFSPASLPTPQSREIQSICRNRGVLVMELRASELE